MGESRCEQDIIGVWGKTCPKDFLGKGFSFENDSFGYPVPNSKREIWLTSKTDKLLAVMRELYMVVP